MAASLEARQQLEQLPSSSQACVLLAAVEPLDMGYFCKAWCCNRARHHRWYLARPVVQARLTLGTTLVVTLSADILERLWEQEQTSHYLVKLSPSSQLVFAQAKEDKVVSV